MSDLYDEAMAGYFNRISEPTHYAVIDEHGEIVQAFKVASYRDAGKDCKSFIDRMDCDCPEAQEWTVKGVMVHD